MRSFLAHPTIYLLFQRLAGTMAARKRMLNAYATPWPGMRVLDIGCGPGYVVRYLPECTYVGYDLDTAYIAHARRKYATAHTFLCQPFDAEQAARHDEFDLVLMIGLLHHLPDQSAVQLVDLAQQVLKRGGMLLTLDGCYHAGQPTIAKWLLDMDRGKHVRDQAGYRALVDKAFDYVETFVRSDLSLLPYTFIVMRCTRG